jgi:hypothetical protein
VCSAAFLLMDFSTPFNIVSSLKFWVSYRDSKRRRFPFCQELLELRSSIPVFDQRTSARQFLRWSLLSCAASHESTECMRGSASESTLVSAKMDSVRPLRECSHLGTSFPYLQIASISDHRYSSSFGESPPGGSWNSPMRGGQPCSSWFYACLLSHRCVRAMAAADRPRVCWEEMPRARFTISGIHPLGRGCARSIAILSHLVPVDVGRVPAPPSHLAQIGSSKISALFAYIDASMISMR